MSSETSPPRSRSTKDAFARVLLKAERGRFPRAQRYTARAGGFGHRPVRHLPVCEVLAALVPERVLPFASGGSRKRGPEPSRGSNLGAVPRWSAERRACPSLPSRHSGRTSGQGARRTAAGLRQRRELVCGDADSEAASIGAPPPFFWEAVRGNSLQNSDAFASRERDCLFTSPRVRGEVERSKGDGASQRVRALKSEPGGEAPSSRPSPRARGEGVASVLEDEMFHSVARALRPRPFHHPSLATRASGGPPPPLSWGRIEHHRVFSKISRPISMRRISLVPAPIS
jgi:hypothetical protein